MAVIDRCRYARTVTVFSLDGLSQLSIVGPKLELKRPPLHRKLLLKDLKARLLAGIESQLMVKNLVQLGSRRPRCRKQRSSDKDASDRGEEASDYRERQP